MKEFILLLILCHVASPETHSMKYIVTAVSGLTGFPEHTEVGLVDDQQFVYYDSDLKKIIPKTGWIEKNVGADYWQRETDRNIATQQVFKANVGIAMARFNQTQGVHILQVLYGCEWDGETGDVTGNAQFGYDGEDFISFDQKTKTWIAPTRESVITKHKWDTNTARNENLNNYLTQECIEWLKKYVGYGKSALQRTVLPSVSLLQKSPSSPVTCHATGFHPDKVMLFWRRDGDELLEDVDNGETLHNHDGTFQKSVDLDISSIRSEDWGKYECVFQLSGEEDIVTTLDAAVIKTNMEKPGDMTIPIIAAVVVIALIAIAAIGIALYKKKQAKCPPSSENSSELSQKLNQEA